MIKNIKKILHSLRENVKYAILTPLCTMFEVIVECCLPFVMSTILDKIESLEASNFNVIWPQIILLIGLSIIAFIFGVLGGRFAALASTGLAKNLRSDLYKKVESFSFKNIDKFSDSSLLTRMTTDIQNIQMSFQMSIRIVIRAPLMFIFSIIMAFISGGHMAWIFICIIPILAGGLYLIFKKAIPVFQRVFKRYDNLNQSVQENISGIRVVKSYVREDFENKKFNKSSDDIAKEMIVAEKILSYTNPVMMFGINMANILVCGFGSLLIISTAKLTGNEITWGKLSVGQFSSLLTYGVQILIALMTMSAVIVMLSMSLECIRRIAEVLDEKPDIVDCENPVYEVKDGSIKFNNVNFKYSESADKYSLSNINIDIKSGQFIGIIGGTGSGKTSLVNLISRLYDTTEGSITVGGVDVKKYDLKTLRDNVAVVLQKNVLFSGTIAENLRWGNENASVEDLKNACEISQANEFISKLPKGFDTYIEQGGANVSGGQKQRLCIARAILKKPKILILDDSTSAVDTKTDAIIRTGLKNIIPDTTKVVIAQRISSIEDADQIIVMNDGTINAIGTHDELLKNNEIYQEVYYTQNKNGGNE